MDESLFEAWSEQYEFAFKSTKKKLKDVWRRLHEEHDVDDDSIAKIIDTIFRIGQDEA